MGFGLIVLALLASLPGCGAPKTFENENDQLRAQKLELERTISDLQERLALREGELRAVREQGEPQTPAIEGVEPPRLAGLVLGMYSGAIDVDGDAVYDALRVYVRPVDQHGRQMSAEGAARVRLVVTPAEGDPVTLLDERYDAQTFHDAYRSGVTGTHYTLEAELPADPPTQATLHVTLADAATGRTFATQKTIELVRGAAAQD